MAAPTEFNNLDENLKKIFEEIYNDQYHQIPITAVISPGNLIRILEKMRYEGFILYKNKSNPPGEIYYNDNFYLRNGATYPVTNIILNFNIYQPNIQAEQNLMNLLNRLNIHFTFHYDVNIYNQELCHLTLKTKTGNDVKKNLRYIWNSLDYINPFHLDLNRTLGADGIPLYLKEFFPTIYHMYNNNNVFKTIQHQLTPHINIHDKNNIVNNGNNIFKEHLFKDNTNGIIYYRIYNFNPAKEQQINQTINLTPFINQMNTIFEPDGFLDKLWKYTVLIKNNHQNQNSANSYDSIQMYIKKIYNDTKLLTDNTKTYLLLKEDNTINMRLNKNKNTQNDLYDNYLNKQNTGLNFNNYTLANMHAHNGIEKLIHACNKAEIMDHFLPYQIFFHNTIYNIKYINQTIIQQKKDTFDKIMEIYNTDDINDVKKEEFLNQLCDTISDAPLKQACRNKPNNNEKIVFLKENINHIFKDLIKITSDHIKGIISVNIQEIKKQTALLKETKEVWLKLNRDYNELFEELKKTEQLLDNCSQTYEKTYDELRDCINDKKEYLKEIDNLSKAYDETFNKLKDTEEELKKCKSKQAQSLLELEKRSVSNEEKKRKPIDETELYKEKKRKHINKPEEQEPMSQRRKVIVPKPKQETMLLPMETDTLPMKIDTDKIYKYKYLKYKKKYLDLKNKL
jgi:hypothetical protein